MESFLNIFWFLLALASLAVWRGRWVPCRRAAGRGQDSLAGFLALCCALLLLFPVISLTDDLHEIPAISEDARSPRRLLQDSKGGEGGADFGKQAAAVVAAFLPNVFALDRMVIGRLVPAETRLPSCFVDRPSGSRAPPFPAL